MKNKLFYILGISSAVLSSCHDDDMADMFLNGKEKTPLPITVALSTGSGVQTRAADMEFASGDELLVYIQHMNGTSAVEKADMAPALVKFKVNPDAAMTPVDNDPTTIQETSDLELKSIQHKGTGDDLKQPGQTTLFWDDFSDSSDEGKDLRTSGHGLLPLYGYCYNGGCPTAELNPTTGELGWTVATDQTSGIKTSDLLWSGTPATYVSYSHANPASVGLRIPYSHAMSKVTVVLVAGKGFVGDDLAGSAITLKNMNTVCTVNAASSSLGKDQITSFSTEGTIKDITMYKHGENGSITVSDVTKPTRAFEAIVVPNKTWAKDNVIATITGMDGNTYNILATESIISQFLHSNTNSYGAGETVTLEPGVNYKLTITLDKQPQNIVAQITNWTNVEATGTGVITFGNDVKTSVVDGAESLANFVGSFDLWRSTTNVDHNSYDEDSGVDGVNKATTVTYSGGKWANSPEIYWKDGTTPYYFRALAQYFDVEETKTIMSIENSFAVEQGKDIVWGTTSKHTGKEADETKTHDYAEGAAIDPRTGDIPLTFYHAMSKISVKLQTSDDASAVSLAGARISIANLYDGGTIDLTDGSINSLLASKPLPIAEFLAAEDSGTDPKLSQYAVIPQSLVKMKDGIDRVGAVSFYNISELTEIGDQLYITSTLDKVYYTEETAATYNAGLEGHVSNGDDMIYTEAQFKALKTSEIPKDLFSLFHFGCNYEEFIALDEQPFINFTNEDYETILTVYTGQGCKHNEISAKAYNAKLPGAVKAGDLQGYKVKDGSKTAKPGDLKTNEANPVIKMLIMLEDGTTYTLNLSDCKDSNGVLVKVWQRGKHYTYNISLKKEEITFRAMVKDWDPSTGSGNATLDWD